MKGFYLSAGRFQLSPTVTLLIKSSPLIINPIRGATGSLHLSPRVQGSSLWASVSLYPGKMSKSHPISLYQRDVFWFVLQNDIEIAGPLQAGGKVRQLQGLSLPHAVMAHKMCAAMSDHGHIHSRSSGLL